MMWIHHTFDTKVSFAEPFAKHESHFKDDVEGMEKVKRWRTALSDAASLKGHHICQGIESENIQQIVNQISSKLCKTSVSYLQDVVGIDTHLEEVKSRLKLEVNDVRIVGIWGVGGIGKTTIARAVFDAHSCQFEAACFIEDIKENKCGMRFLQNILLSELLREKDNYVNNKDGKHMIARRLPFNKVLVVLDDIDHSDHLHYLAGNLSWYGNGSRIIATTRDKHLFGRNDVVYEVTTLVDRQAIKLFNQYAFKEEVPDECFEKLSLEIVRHANGLPLALKVWGSFLHKRDIIEWRSAIEEMKNNSNSEILEKLTISYDRPETVQRDIFLYWGVQIEPLSQIEPMNQIKSRKKIDLWFGLIGLLYSIRGMPHVLYVWMYECCSEVDSTMAERLGNVIPRIFNWQVVEIKVKYEKFMTGMFSKFMYNNIRPTHKEVQSLNLQMIERFQLKEAECGLPPEIAADCSDKRLAGGVQLQEDLDIEEFEEFSTVPPTEILKKAGLITDDSTSHPSKKRKIVHFDSTTAEDQIIPSSSLKSVYQDNSDEKSDDIKLILQSYCQQEGEEKTGNVHANEDVKATEIFKTLKEKGKKIVGETDKSTDVYSTDDPMDGHYFDWNRSLIQQQSQDVERCSEDNATANLDALVESVVNHNSNNTIVGTSTTVHVHNDHMVHYSSTLPESSQVELDTILKVIAALVDEVPKEVVPPSESIVNQHNISDSQLPLDFPDSVVAAHQAVKPPAKIAKRIRTRSKVFKSPYTTEYASGSKAIEDQIEEERHQFAFDGFLISDIIPSGVIAEFKQWVEAELLKFHAKNKFYDETSHIDWPNLETYRDKITQMTQVLNEHPLDIEYVQDIMQQERDSVDCGVFVASYAEFLSEEMNVPSHDFEAEYH
ncbi:hypothetical protein FXO38_20426 [Capsicum annuum]|nr:hypothetical protein FXO38_20426 [Capsicum annuum]